MNVTEQELRAMVRDAIARRQPAAAPRVSLSPVDATGPHPSHGRLALAAGGDSEGRCLIEPAVACTHCGYCQSMGH